MITIDQFSPGYIMICRPEKSGKVIRSMFHAAPWMPDPQSNIEDACHCYEMGTPMKILEKRYGLTGACLRRIFRFCGIPARARGGHRHGQHRTPEEKRQYCAERNKEYRARMRKKKVPI